MMVPLVSVNPHMWDSFASTDVQEPKTVERDGMRCHAQGMVFAEQIMIVQYVAVMLGGWVTPVNTNAREQEHLVSQRKWRRSG